MNDQERELKLLLLDSGELPKEEAAQLEADLLADPELASRRDEFRVLQDAGRFASRTVTPPVPDLIRERIVQQCPRPNRALPRLLALAAGLVVAFAVGPHLWKPSGIEDSNPLVTVSSPDPMTEAIADHTDPVLESLDQLDQELDTLLSADLTAELALGDANDWAAELLALEDSI